MHIFNLSIYNYNFINIHFSTDKESLEYTKDNSISNSILSPYSPEFQLGLFYFKIILIYFVTQILANAVNYYLSLRICFVCAGNF